jgi:hypothetical protein
MMGIIVICDGGRLIKEDKNIRVIGLLTTAMGLLYFPTILQLLWNLESAEIGLLWCFIQIFIGVALYSKDWHRIQNPILLANFIYQLIWSNLIIDQIIVVGKRIGYYPYLLHIVIAFSSGWYYFQYRKKSSSLR